MADGTGDTDRLGVFISYSRDDLDFADQLDVVLGLAGFDPVLDRHGIHGAENWQEKLGALIRDADTVVFVLSPASAKSDICGWEVREAVNLGKRIIPVVHCSLGDVQPPPQLAALNYIFFYPEPKKPGSGFRSGVPELINALKTDRGWLREHTRLLQRALEWDAGGRQPNRLLSGSDIAEAKTWSAQRPKDASPLTALHFDFIRASEETEAARSNIERQRLEEVALAQDEREKALNVAEKVQATLAEQLKRDRRRQLLYAWVLNVAVALTILVISIPTAGAIIARGLSADWQTDAFLDVPTTQHGRLAVVAVDERALAGYSSLPADRHVLAQLVRRIDDLGAAAIGLDYYFVGPTEPEKDAELIDALRSAKAQIVVGAADERAGLEPRQYEFQRQFVTQIGRPAGYLALGIDGDDVVRRQAYPIKGGTYSESFAALFARAGGAVDTPPPGRIAWLGDPQDGADTFLTVLASDLLQADQTATAEADILKGRLVIVGILSQLMDRHKTPLSSAWTGASVLNGVMIHAQIAAQILDGRSVGELKPVLTGIVTMTLGLALGWLSRRRSVLWMIITASLGALAIFGVLAAFAASRFYVPWGITLACWLLGMSLGRTIGLVRQPMSVAASQSND